MPPICPSGAVRAARTSLRTPKQTLPAPSPASRRPFASTPRRADSHESPYDAPGGWLWGVKPGEKYQNEGWERPMFWGFGGSLVLTAIALQFKPDTG